jgi:hypothetical protein
LNQHVQNTEIVARRRDAGMKQLQDDYLARLGPERTLSLLDVFRKDPDMGKIYEVIGAQNLRDAWIRVELTELGLSDEFDEVMGTA